MTGIEILPVRGLPEIEAGDDLAALIAAAADLLDGDVLVVAQKIISKAEGRLVPVDPARRAEERAAWVAREAVRTVARRGDIAIVETRHGLVCANAGIDGSNVPADRLALLPEDPDGSASRIREGIARATGKEVAVIVSDTFGRPWRIGQTNVAIGLAGLRPLRDHRGEADSFGHVLEATVIAVADEIAGAAELVMGKSDGVPVAVVRGLESLGGIGSAAALVRGAEEDMFRTGALETVEARRSVRRFSAREIPEEAIRRATAAAATAPAPHGSRVPRPWRFVWLRSQAAREPFLAAMADSWRADLSSDGVPADRIEAILARSDSLVGKAPAVIACFVSTSGADSYPDARRARAERDLFIASAGAAVQNLMVALAAQGIGSCWVSSSMFCPEAAASAAGLGTGWSAAGCVAAGYAAEHPPARSSDTGACLNVL